jgi:Ca2+-binding EF-hand superfamily protein
MLRCGLLLAVCSALLGAGCAGTSPGLSDTIEGSFIRAVKTWDLNRDGKVTCEEWRSYVGSLFMEADSDHDGKLTREEFAKLPKIDRLFEVANFDYYDVNRQGHLTQADFVDRPNPAFAALHQDKSCVITSDQLRAFMAVAEGPDTAQKRSSSQGSSQPSSPSKTCGSCMPTQWCRNQSCRDEAQRCKQNCSD